MKPTSKRLERIIKCINREHFVSGEYVALSEVLLMSKELLTYRKSSQKRERDVFKALCDSCEHYGNFSGECHYRNRVEKSYKCTLRNCPLLNQKKEIK